MALPPSVLRCDVSLPQSGNGTLVLPLCVVLGWGASRVVFLYLYVESNGRGSQLALANSHSQTAVRTSDLTAGSLCERGG